MSFLHAISFGREARRARRALVAASALTALSLLGTPGISCDAHAAAAAPASAQQDVQLDRLVAAGHSVKWNYSPQGRSERFGHSEVLINAPMAAVRAQVLDFSHYKEFAPDKFKNARMVGKEGSNVDMYFQVPIMHGMMTLWYIARFGGTRVIGPGTEAVEGKFVRGNIKDMNLVFTMRAIEPNWTILSCDLLLTPNIPAPQSAIDEELRDAAMQAVDAIKDRAQGKSVNVPYMKSDPPPPQAQPAQAPQGAKQ
jgi:hypothetical protein